jgi:Zn-dependent M28 family amino/carboxypeptidase
MTTRSLSILAALALFTTAPLSAQRPARTPEARVIAALSGDVVWSALRFLSDDLLEGRGTGARGGQLTTAYLAAQFMALGLEPAGDNGTWFHRVPIVTLVPNATLEAGGRPLRFRDDFVAWAERPDTLVSAEGELVFVGFGITAPEENWDDFKNVDVRGKIVLMLVNDPGIRNPRIFRGDILTYYGRWTYKLEEAARRGAAGVLLVHNDTLATYGWNTVRNSWTGDQVRLETAPASLAWAGWIQQSVAAELLRARGHDLTAMMRAAATPGFRPVETGITVRGVVRSTLRRSTTDNVVARLPGSDPALRDEAVVIGGHWDHLGIGEPVNGDSIMNGAMDNASGMATILGVAEAFVRSGVRGRRSLLFVGFAAEEKGLLGSQAFATRPPIPAAQLAAMLNVDVTNLWGRTRDIAVLGADQSTLGALFAAAARAEGLRVSVDSGALRRGSFFRSDHFPLARIGIPALSWERGTDFVNRPPGWAAEQERLWNRERYHQPADEILPWYTVDGTLQQARVLIRVALAAANAAAQPSWNPTSEFAAAGRARLGR